MRTGAPALRLVRPGEVPPRDLARRLLERCSFPVAEADAAPAELPCAVSGGADSLALLVLALEAGLRPVAYHVDHGLRSGSADEFAVVEEAARRLSASLPPDRQVEARSLRVDVAPGPNLEARAREARFAVLPSPVATGHTADDQAETVLINLLRGSSGSGLSGMAPGARHPILGVRRSETRAVCREAGLEWLEDPSNEDLGPLRNRVRHELLPRLNEMSGRDLVPVLCRQAELLRDDAVLLDELAAAIDPTDARQLSAAPLPLARRAVRSWLREGTTGSHPPSSAAVERVLGVASGRALACDIGGGVAVRRRRGRLVIESRPCPVK
jgi:tRNA(Ile)-lysidine synthase